MSKNSRTKLKLLTSVTTISLISVSVIGTHTTEVSANPFSRLLSRIRTAAGSLTISNPFSKSKSFTLNRSSSNGKLSSSPTPQKTTWQDFINKYRGGSDIIITSNNQTESTTSNNKQNKSNLLSKVKGFFTNNGGSKSSKINVSGTVNPTFESNEDVTTTTSQTNGGNSTNTSTEENRRKLLMGLYEESSDIFVTGNPDDVQKNQTHYSRLGNGNNPKTQPPVPPKKYKLTVTADIHTTSNGSSSSSNDNNKQSSTSLKLTP